MNTAWETLADALRAEIAEYGSLLHLLEEQRRFIFQRDVGVVLQSTHSIQPQVDVLQECRERRERAMAEFASANGRAAHGTLRSLLPLVPAEGRPLLEALIAEVNRLVHRLRRAMRLNERLLLCTVECHQELLRRLWPSAFTKTYASNGRVAVTTLHRGATMQTAG